MLYGGVVHGGMMCMGGSMCMGGIAHGGRCTVGDGVWGEFYFCNAGMFPLFAHNFLVICLEGSSESVLS